VFTRLVRFSQGDGIPDPVYGCRVSAASDMTRPALDTYDSPTVRADTHAVGIGAGSAVVTEWRQFVVRPPPGRGWRDVVWWWDSRRLLYSLIVLAATIAMVVLRAVYILVRAAWDDTSEVFASSIGSEVLIFIGWPVFLMLAANAWFTGGWVLELALRIALRDRLPWLAPVLLAAGVAFSIVFVVVISTWLLP
jgi:hypothetical protein